MSRCYARKYISKYIYTVCTIYNQSDQAALITLLHQSSPIFQIYELNFKAAPLLFNFFFFSVEYSPLSYVYVSRNHLHRMLLTQKDYQGL